MPNRSASVSPFCAAPLGTKNPGCGSGWTNGGRAIVTAAITIGSPTAALLVTIAARTVPPLLNYNI